MPAENDGKGVLSESLEVSHLSVGQIDSDDVLRSAFASLILGDLAVGEAVSALGVAGLVHAEDFDWLGIFIVILNIGTLLIKLRVEWETSVQIQDVADILHQENESALGVRQDLRALALFDRGEVDLDVAILLDLVSILLLLKLSRLGLNSKHHLVLHKVISSEIDAFIVVHQSFPARSYSTTLVPTALIARA